jgi:hypothetical protein
MIPCSRVQRAISTLSRCIISPHAKLAARRSVLGSTGHTAVSGHGFGREAVWMTVLSYGVIYVVSVPFTCNRPSIHTD